MEFYAEDLRFYLMPSANPPTDRVYFHNNIYRLWRDIWEQTFAKLGIPAERLNGEFARQDWIACIALGDRPLAVHLYSFFAIDSLSSREHPYMSSNYNELYFARLAKAGVRTVMSLEYMTVHPAFRKGTHGVHLGAVLVGLAMNTMKLSGADAAIAPARRDHKVHELAYAFGGEPVIENVINHNAPCDLLMCQSGKVKPNPSLEINQLMQKLWNGRELIANPQISAGHVLTLSSRKAA
jgi:hypothetical protein